MRIATFVPMLAVLVCFPFEINATEPFEDVTESVGLNGLSGGVAAWTDYNNDGWVDLYTGGVLWRNEAGKKFVKIENIPLGGDGLWVDFNNDGWLDFFSWGGTGKVFLSQEGKKFKDLGEKLPPLPTKISLGATSADFNGDGYADLYVTGYEIFGKENYHDVIYFNKGGESFEEAWRSTTLQPGRGVTAADFDEDNDVDIYVSNYRLVPNVLWQNDSTGKFTDVAKEFKVDGDGDLGAWGHTIGSSWGDFDNDGHIDLFVGNFSHPPAYQDRPKFLRNTGTEGKFHFEEKTGEAGLHWQESYASPTLADYDNDGLLDLFFTTVYGGDASVLYRNTGKWKFENVTAASKVSSATTYQAAWADFNNDGALDLVTGGKLFKNSSGGNNWLKVRLRGKDSVNASALGAQIRIKIGDQVLTRQVSASTGQGNQNDLTQHFGLGKHEGPVKLEIRWPNGVKQDLETESNRVIDVLFKQ